MGSDTHATPALCSRFHQASELVGRRWTGAIIYVLLQQRCRFAALRAAIPDITDRMLSERLQELEDEEIVARTVVPATPVRVEYSLTPKGRALTKAMDAIADWAHDWVPLEAAQEPAKPERRTTRPARARAARKPVQRTASARSTGR
jgi:DNA-binding HxlR family transcriptional regulator